MSDAAGEGEAMARIDEEEVRRVARLARLALDGEAVARLAVELEGVLAHMDEIARLEEGPAGEDEGPEGRGLDARLRPDAPGSDPLAFGPERMAPEWKDGFFVVPSLASLAEREAP